MSEEYYHLSEKNQDFDSILRGMLVDEDIKKVLSLVDQFPMGSFQYYSIALYAQALITKYPNPDSIIPFLLPDSHEGLRFRLIDKPLNDFKEQFDYELEGEVEDIKMWDDEDDVSIKPFHQLFSHSGKYSIIHMTEYVYKAYAESSADYWSAVGFVPVDIYDGDTVIPFSDLDEFEAEVIFTYLLVVFGLFDSVNSFPSFDT